MEEELQQEKKQQEDEGKNLIAFIGEWDEDKQQVIYSNIEFKISDNN